MSAAAVEAGKENAGAVANASQPAPRAFSPGELKNMLGQCLKMASENKITPQNTWALPLIEHLPELIREEGGQQTNFQRASVTLDAGVKIYSYRVDSVHTETFKILGGLGRAANTADELEAGDLGDGGVGGDGEEATRRRRRTHELNPEATLEASLEALNVKKFDLAFAVDPLFHKTSAQFDEGGAKGLLLNNLSVYRGCDIVFDSMDVPETAMDSAAAADPSKTVNLGSLQQQLAALQLQSGGERISPTLDAILELLEEAPGDGAAAAADDFVWQVAAGVAAAAGSDATAPMHQAEGGEGEAAAAQGEEEGEEEGGVEGVIAEYAHAAPPEPADMPAEDFDDDGGGFDGGFDDYSDADEPQQQPLPEGGEGAGAVDQHHHSAAADALGEDAIQWLIEAGSNNAATRAKGWAGGAHWKYRAVPQAAVDGKDGVEEGGKPKKRTTRRKNDPLDFVALMEAADAPALPEFELLPEAPQQEGEGGQKPKKKRARRARAAAKTLLPEDHHYNVDQLNRYALRPRNALVAGGEGGGAGAPGTAGAGAVAGAEPQPGLFNGDDDGFAGFGDGGYDDDDDDDDVGEAGYDGNFDMGDMLAEGGLEMVQAARKVERVEVNYSRAAKQVDVRSLKELMWHGLHAVPAPGGVPPSPDSVLQFKDVLATVPERNPAGRLEDLSVHLCFICVLHLANEHGLTIQSVPALDQLHISNVPPAER